MSSFQPRQGQGLSASLTAVDAVERLFCLAPQRTCMHVLYVTARGGRTWMHMWWHALEKEPPLPLSETLSMVLRASSGAKWRWLGTS